jgi:imidazoleglycerol-phosphate dehydratase
VRLEFGADKVGDFDVEVVEDFFQAFAANGRLALHVRELAGRNTHHKVEAAFKAVGRALAAAVAFEEGREAVPSTKGVL